MGTRGTFGVRINGKDKLAYNHFDSYPSGLGVAILGQLRAYLAPDIQNGIDCLKQRADVLRQVTDDTEPTPEEIEKLAQYADEKVSTGQKTEWYVLLRNLQGDLLETLKAGYMGEGNDFIHDSLFCEWGYIVNLDDGTLEVYQGFQKKPHDKGRYSSHKPETKHPDGTKKSKDYIYYACALIATFPLAELPTDEDFLHIVDPPEEEEAA